MGRDGFILFYISQVIVYHRVKEGHESMAGAESVQQLIRGTTGGSQTTLPQPGPEGLSLVPRPSPSTACQPQQTLAKCALCTSHHSRASSRSDPLPWLTWQI